MDLLRREQEALAKFLHRLGNPIQGVGKVFDVLAFEGGDEGGIDRLADLRPDLLLLAARLDEFIEQGGLVGVLAQLDQRLDAGARLLGAGFQQIEKLVFLTQ